MMWYVVLLWILCGLFFFMDKMVRLKKQVLEKRKKAAELGIERPKVEMPFLMKARVLWFILWPYLLFWPLPDEMIYKIADNLV